jgi:hypothetical protein
MEREVALVWSDALVWQASNVTTPGTNKAGNSRSRENFIGLLFMNVV